MGGVEAEVLRGGIDGGEEVGVFLEEMEAMGLVFMGYEGAAFGWVDGMRRGDLRKNFPPGVKSLGVAVEASEGVRPARETRAWRDWR